jgi:hypothetical protein
VKRLARRLKIIGWPAAAAANGIAGENVASVKAENNQRKYEMQWLRIKWPQPAAAAAPRRKKLGPSGVAKIWRIGNNISNERKYL